jgi:hypothetical protein
MPASERISETPSSQAGLSGLRLILSDRFAEGELRDLCFDLAVDYDSLFGTSKSDKARELVAHLDRRGKIPSLLAIGQRLRPDIDWHEMLTPSDTAPAASASTPTRRPPASNAALGDTFTMSGNFRGAVLNIKSTLTDVQQSVGAIPVADQATRDELIKLIAQLNVVLQTAPPDRSEQAEAVAEMAKALIDSATGDRPNKTMVRIAGESLDQAAADLAHMMADISVLATQIVTTVNELVDQR